MCKIAILEKYALFSSGIKAILENVEDVKINAEAESVDEIIQKLDNNLPDAIIIDIIHCENSGIKPLKKLKRNYPKVPVLVIVSEDYAYCFEDYIRLGANGFVFNDSSAEELVKAIKELERGKDYFPKEVWELFKSSLQSRKYARRKVNKLTDREVTVMKLFSRGLSYKEIGANLNISPRTVETHKNNILSKLKINSKAEMIKYAIQNNLIT